MTFSRRRFLLATAATPLLLAGCGSEETPAAGGGARFGTVSQRLAWIKNTQFAGSYVADKKGYYRAEGFSGADLVAGGPTAPPIESDVLGRTFAGVSQVPIVGSAVAKGAPLKIIGAVYTRYAGCVMSMTDKPIKTPEDLYGKTIGCASSSEPVWRTFLAASGLDQSRIKTVPVQGNPIGMTKGEIDGYLGFINSQVIDLRHLGHDITTMLLADVGFPLVGQTYITTQEHLDNDRDQVKAFLRAEIKGWRDVLADPQYATDLTVDEYGKDLKLDPAATLDCCKAGNELIRDGQPTQQLIALTDQQAEDNVKAINAGGLKLTADQLFDLGPIREVYQEDPGLAATVKN
ncbi:ABC transporter substrate-binding protein [Nonomuraea sp. MG754425]|uniref:ABC transporter substrate-binding protein n=1 Tax=Nonomuraea sp. MG754425 TaxID=2570319 RepID=UPI001F27D9A2|nr:ABC transporter substrate-binding protein [Nonomuraea sp. MG754425]MCF6470378.1 ABC transporter substrate-binding protein [Nonomuraea sp. MG754425]